jgi:hypothetical protein
MAIKAQKVVALSKPSLMPAQSRRDSASRRGWSGAALEAPAAVLRPATILAIQKQAGNHVAQRAIARQATTESDDLATPRFAGDPLPEACS